MAKYEIVLTEEQNQIIKQVASESGISEQELIKFTFIYGYNKVYEVKNEALTKNCRAYERNSKEE